MIQEEERYLNKLGLTRHFPYELTVTKFRCKLCGKNQEVGIIVSLNKQCLKCSRGNELIPNYFTTASQKLYKAADLLYRHVVYDKMTKGVYNHIVPLNFTGILWLNPPECVHLDTGNFIIGRGEQAYKIKSDKERQLIQFYVLNRLLREQERYKRAKHFLINGAQNLSVRNDFPQDYICPFTMERLKVTDCYINNGQFITLAESAKMYGKVFVYTDNADLRVE